MTTALKHADEHQDGNGANEKRNLPDDKPHPIVAQLADFFVFWIWVRHFSNKIFVLLRLTESAAPIAG